MSSVLPPTKLARIEFCENHDTPFSTNAVAIGTTAAAVTDLATKTSAARAAYNAQQAAQNAAKAATNDYNIAVEAMTTAAADIIKQIKAKAATAGPGVYSLAEIPAPAVPSPRPAPGTPTDFAAALDGNGALSLKWKCANPPGSSGTIYQVWRRNSPTGEFTYLGGSGSKDFVDATIPAGSAAVTYQIQAVRSTAVGAWAQFNVNFGVAAGGGAGAPMTVSVVETRPTRVAA
jgi:hypothetical protein